MQKPTVTIGLLTHFDAGINSPFLDRTLQFLRTALPQYTIHTQPLSTVNAVDELRTKNVDFFIASSGINALVSAQVGSRQIATLTNTQARNSAKSVASVFVVRRDSPIRTFAQMQHRRVAASQPNSFEGWQIALGEIARRGFDPDDFFSQTQFVHYQFPDVLSSLLSGGTDVGIVSACLLEQLEQQGLIEKTALRVVAPRNSTRLACQHSTDLYPGLVMASMERTAATVTRDMTIALLSLPASDRFLWTISSDSVQVDALFRQLGLGPYRYMKDWSVSGIWQRFHKEILLFLLALALLVAHEFRLKAAVNQRTRELLTAQSERARSQQQNKAIAQRLADLERQTVIAHMSSMIAHELKQPVGSIINYIAGLRLHLQQLDAADPVTNGTFERVSAQATRIAAIIDRVRGYAKRRQTQPQITCVQDIISRAVRSVQTGELDHVPLTVDAGAAVFVEADPLELELAFANLLKNASEAALACPAPQVRLTLEVIDNSVCITISDNGPQLSTRDFERLSQCADSVKTEGLGLGLSIVRGIADSNGASVHFYQNDGAGIRAVWRMPTAGAASQQEPTA